MTDLQQHVLSTPLVDTHDHQRREQDYLQTPVDVLVELFDNYITADLAVAGASPEAIQKLLDANDPDVEGRFEAVRQAWEQCQYTGYGEAVRLIARVAFGMEEIRPDTLQAAQARFSQTHRRLGDRLHIFKELGNIDHVQVDAFGWQTRLDEGAPDYFLYDISWASFCQGELDLEAIATETGVEVKHLASLRYAMERIFEKYAHTAIAVKAQHAYNRTLRWLPREDSDAERVLMKMLAGQPVTVEEKLCLGDWCWSRGAELCAQHNLPFKIHTGYLAGYGRTPVHNIQAGNLWELLASFPQTRFVLMHIAYPYSDELVGLAKRYPNVYVDMCWAWSIDPYSAGDFFRCMIHAVPINKLFAFGADTGLPYAAVAYAMQARKGLVRALQAEKDDGYLTEREAMHIATRVMRENQYACFDVEGRRENIRRMLCSKTG